MKLIKALLLVSTAALAGCSAQREAKISASYQGDYDKVVSSHEKSVDGAIYSAANPGFFVGDRRARAVGDVLTVMLAETTNASKSADATLARDGSNSVTLPPAIFGPLGIASPVLTDANLGAASTQDYSGSGEANQSNSITGTLTVMVTRVYQNGNMWVEGQKMLTLNNGEEFVRISGLVRPEDIAAGNTIVSGRIAQAQISYTGSGDLADASRQGWFGRFFGWAAPI